MVRSQKQTLRLICRRIRHQLPTVYQKSVSDRICARIEDLESYRNAKHIALYYAMNGEVNLQALWQSAQDQGKYCYFPVLNHNRTLSFLPASANTLFYPNPFGIQQPDEPLELARSPEQLDLIIMPLLAFDEHGTRLGMGGGYYDRTLAHCQVPFLLGVAYEFQKQSFIKPDPWDVPLRAIITQQTIYWSNT